MADKVNNKVVKQYLREVKSLLICDGKTKRRFVKQFGTDVEAYMEEQGVTDIQSLYTAFGEPIDIARGFFETADIKSIKRKMNVKRVILWSLIAVIMFWAGAVTIDLIDSLHSNHGYGVTAIEDENGNEVITAIEYFGNGD